VGARSGTARKTTYSQRGPGGEKGEGEGGEKKGGFAEAVRAYRKDPTENTPAGACPNPGSPSRAAGRKKKKLGRMLIYKIYSLANPVMHKAGNQAPGKRKRKRKGGGASRRQSTPKRTSSIILLFLAMRFR